MYCSGKMSLWVLAPLENPYTLHDPPCCSDAGTTAHDSELSVCVTHAHQTASPTQQEPRDEVLAAVHAIWRDYGFSNSSFYHTLDAHTFRWSSSMRACCHAKRQRRQALP